MSHRRHHCNGGVCGVGNCSPPTDGNSVDLGTGIGKNYNSLEVTRDLNFPRMRNMPVGKAREVRKIAWHFLLKLSLNDLLVC